MSERVARFINSLRYKEITLKSDTEPATIAFRSRVAENYKAEVTLEDAVKGDTRPHGLVENAVMLLRGVTRTIKCHVESCTQESTPRRLPFLPWLVEHAGSNLSRCQKGRDGRTPFERSTARVHRQTSRRISLRSVSRLLVNTSNLLSRSASSRSPHGNHTVSFDRIFSTRFVVFRIPGAVFRWHL